MKSMSRGERKRKAKAVKAAKVLAGALKGVGDKPSMTLPVEQVLAMGLPKECNGGRIITDEVLDADEGTRLCEYEKEGVTYAFAYDEGDDPFGPQLMIDITVVGTFH